MPFKIRTKLITAFFGIIFPFLLIVGTISIYNLYTIYKGIHEIEEVTVGLPWVMRLQFDIDRALMPGNDYIITGDKKYIDDFKTASTDVEERLAELEMVLTTMQDGDEIKAKREIMEDVKKAWQKIKELSQRIFALRDPTGRDAPAGRLYMEEMDYKWAGLAIETLKLWQGIDNKRFRKAHDRSEGAWRQAWIILIAGFVILVTVGISFAIYYSKIFVTPINTLHKGAEAIAAGDFKTRLDIKTGDEVEQLSNAMNEMAEQLDTFTSNLQGIVEERTMELRESEERFRQLFDVGNDAVFVHGMTPEGKPTNFIEVNEVACKRLGYTREELLNMSPLDIDAPEIANQRASIVEDLLSNKKVVFEMVHVARDGRHIPVEISSRLFELKGQPMALSIARDITDRKLAEEALQKSEEQYRTLFETMMDGFVLFEMIFGPDDKAVDARYISVNPAFEKHTGLKISDVIGKTVSEVMPTIGPQWLDRYEEVIRTGVPGQFERYNEALARHYYISAYRIDDEHIAVVFQDISERKKAEDALKRKITELEQFRKVTIKRELRIEELQRKVEEMEKELKRR